MALSPHRESIIKSINESLGRLRQTAADYRDLTAGSHRALEESRAAIAEANRTAARGVKARSDQ